VSSVKLTPSMHTGRIGWGVYTLNVDSVTTAAKWHNVKNEVGFLSFKFCKYGKPNSWGKKILGFSVSTTAIVNI
jgi:hypothetical protein